MTDNQMDDWDELDEFSPEEREEFRKLRAERKNIIDVAGYDDDFLSEPDDIEPEEVEEIGLDEDELRHVAELAEHPELENYDIAHARQGGRSK